MSSKRIVGLDSLRFISISFVVLLHLFTFKDNFGFSSHYFEIFEVLGGKYAVQFFFCLSGFLLTYLLLAELQAVGKINLKHFLYRRILRIWPAYYLLIFISLLCVLHLPFFEIPGITDTYLAADYKTGNLLYFLFLPHIAPFFSPTAPYVHQTYTIGIEEQFYLIWGLLFYFFPKNIFWILLVIVIGAPLLNFLHHELYINLQSSSSPSSLLILIKKGLYYFQYSRFSTFSIGSLFGYAFFFERRWIFYFKKTSMQIVVCILLLLSIYYRFNFPFVQLEYIAFVICCFMLVVSFKVKSMRRSNFLWLENLGKISYGMYLFHSFAIVFIIKLLSGVGMSINTLPQVILLCLLTLVLSILFGWLSYYGFEIVFLRIKQRFKKG